MFLQLFLHFLHFYTEWSRCVILIFYWSHTFTWQEFAGLSSSNLNFAMQRNAKYLRTGLRFRSVAFPCVWMEVEGLVSAAVVFATSPIDASSYTGPWNEMKNTDLPQYCLKVIFVQRLFLSHICLDICHQLGLVNLLTNWISFELIDTYISFYIHPT